MAIEAKESTPLEREALKMAELITSYSPESAWANESPLQYALFMSYARRAMVEAGIEPDANLRCWFWQIQLHLHSGADGAQIQVEKARLKPAPELKNGVGLWVLPGSTEVLSEDEFRRLYPN
jgi:hypothetical protein